MESERVPTGIEGLDRLIEGGFPRGSLILLAGPAGSGKTLFSSQYLYHGIKKFNEPGMYVSFAENRDTFLSNMNRMGMDFAWYEHERKFRFADLLTVREEGITDVLQTALAMMNDIKAQRMVVDSLTAMAQAFRRPIEARIVIHTILGKIVRQIGCTTLVVVEKGSGADRIGLGIEEFVADGLVLLSMTPEKDLLSRRIQVMKMRGTKVDTSRLRYDIREDGLRLYDRPSIQLVDREFKDKTTMGIDGLDKMLHGGVFKGSTTLLAGLAGTGKTTAGLHFVNAGVHTKERGLFVSFEEPFTQLVKQSQSFGWEITEPVEQGFIRYASYPADSFNLDQHLLQVQNLLEAQKPDRAVVDSLSSLSEVLTHEEVIKYVKTVQSYLKAQGVTSLFITSSETGDVTPNGEISTLVDNIVSFQQFEIDSALKRSLVVFKARGTQHDTDIREFEITSKGISVKGKFAGVEQILGGAARKTVLTQIRRRP